MIRPNGKAIGWATVTTPPALSISAVFGGMRDGAKRKRALLIRITLLFATLTAASILLELLGSVGFALSLGAGILLGVAYSGMVAAMICLPETAGTPAEVWTRVRPVLSRLIWARLLITVAILAGLVALIVPGLILATIWAVVVPVIVIEKLPVMDSLRRSRELVRGNGWRVFGFLVCLGLLSAIGVMLVYLASAPLGTGILGSIVFQFLIACVVDALASVGIAALYNELTGAPADPLEEPPVPL